MKNTKPAILEIMDFPKAFTAYHDSNGHDVCGSCGSYYVINPNELKEIQNTVKSMYKALKLAREAIANTCIIASVIPVDSSVIKKIDNALSKAEGIGYEQSNLRYQKNL